jgi:hypothetical protein
MNSNRIITTVLAIVIGGGFVLFLGNKFLVQRYIGARDKLSYLEDERDKQEREKNFFNLAQADVAKWKKLSLPKDYGVARFEYQKLLQGLMEMCNVTELEMRPTTSAPQISAAGNQKKPRHISLVYNVKANGQLKAIGEFLMALPRMPVMHRVTSIDMERPSGDKDSGRVNVTMVIEALIVAEANNDLDFSSVLSNPGPQLVKNRDYNGMQDRNPFTGLVIPAPPPPPPPPPTPEELPKGPDVRDFIFIDAIGGTSNDAWLRNTLYKTGKMRLRAQKGFDVFSINSESGNYNIVTGKVLRVDARDVYFQVREKVYRIHFGQTMADAMANPLPPESLDEELTSLKVDDFGNDGVADRKIAREPGVMGVPNANRKGTNNKTPTKKNKS